MSELSAFGVVHKGLPSYVKNTPIGSLKPLAAARKMANDQGARSAWHTNKAVAGGEKAGGTHRYLAGQARNKGLVSSRRAKEQMLLHNPQRRTA